VETPPVRRIAAAVAVSLLFVAVFALPFAGVTGVARAATPQPKVVIIVGPVAGSTGYYKSDGDAAYAEARKYTTNVVKIYTPNATWVAAKKALQGASVVIYMGHGNGFPSPYRSSPWPYSQNGLGLNPKAGVNDSTTQYWGEYYLANEVKLAPNAIVLLHHLCYASGNSESGHPKPTVAQAKQRVDNMAAGWLKAGARAVVAEGHFGPSWYVRQLFTTHKTVDRIFHDSPTFNDNAFTFASTRTRGATAEMDPDGTPGGYWRAVTGWLGTTTDEITGAAYADTGTDPADFQVPGAASVGVDVGGVFADETLTPAGDSGPPASLVRDTQIRLVSRAGTTTPAGAPIFEVATLDGAVTGWMSGSDLVPRDSAGPVVWTVDDGDGAFSPNGDGSGDTYHLSGRVSEVAHWTATFTNADGDVLGTKSSTGDTFSATWSGLVAGSPVPDGMYRWRIDVNDDWGNPEGTRSGTFAVDTVAPILDDPGVAAASATAVPVLQTFSPNGDGAADTIDLAYSINEPGYIDMTVTDAAGAGVRSSSARVGIGPGKVSWDGMDDAGHVARNGIYAVALAPRDYAGNIGAGRDSAVGVYKTLSHVVSAKTVFFPQDLDKYARTARFSFDLSVSAKVTGEIRNAAGETILTFLDGVSLGAGTHVFDWDGRLAGGAMAPRGSYTAVIGATDGELSTSGRASVLADAFRITLNDSTPGRGQTVTLYATSPELLKSSPRVKVSQSGTTSFSLTMTKMSSTTYKLTIKLKSAGTAGTVRFSLSGTDGGGKVNRASRVFVLH
jgi:flagellar hook assembly protein FlgD